MGQEYDFETRECAEELYVVDGLTFEQVAQRTGVSVTQLKTWSAAEKWREKRQEYRVSLKDIKSKTIKLKRALIDKALEKLDPQTVYAFASIEAITRQKKNDAPAVEIPAPITRRIETPEDAVTAIRDAVQQKLNTMLSTGNFSSRDIADLEKSMKLVEALETKYLKGAAPEEKKKKSLDPETLKTIREEIYGLRPE